MKYKIGDIVLLESGESVHIFMIDKDGKRYFATSCDDVNKTLELKDSDIMQLVTTS